VAALLCRNLLEDIVLESTTGSSSMVVHRMALALCSTSFDTTYLVIYTRCVSCWAPLKVQRGVCSIDRFLVVVGFLWRCASDGGVTRRVHCSMAPI
jgi:hypothetical protein